MSQSSPIVLASGHLNRSGDTAQHRTTPAASSPSFVMVVWPAKPSVTAPTPKALAALAAAMVRTMAEAQTELAEDQDWTVATETRADRASGLCAAPWSARLIKLRVAVDSPPRTPGEYRQPQCRSAGRRQP